MCRQWQISLETFEMKEAATGEVLGENILHVANKGVAELAAPCQSDGFSCRTGRLNCNLSDGTDRGPRPS